MAKVATVTDMYDIGSEALFRATIDALSARTFDGGDSPYPLLRALGCHSVWGEISKGNPVKKQPLLSEESLVLTLLLRALRSTAKDPSPTICMSIIDGLARNNRWHSCLLDSDLARDLALVLVNAANTMHQMSFFSKNTIYQTVLAPAVCTMLNVWLKPVEKFKTPPAVGALARAMFGDPWCILNDIDGRSGYEAADMIREGRPLFLPGLVSAQRLGDTAVTLPPMDCP